MTKAVPPYEKDYAKYDSQHALLDGIFEPARKVKDADLRLRKIEGYCDYIDQETSTKHTNAVFLRLLVPYLLGTQAEAVLLAIIKLSGKNGFCVSPNQLDLLSLLEPERRYAEGDAKDKDTAIIITTLYQLLKESGMSTGESGYKLLKMYLEQMSSIRVYFENSVSGWSGSDWFMSFRVYKDGRLVIKLNWRLTGAIFGIYNYSEINLHERHALKKDASKTLHRWLSAHLWAGKTKYIRNETLIGHIWSENACPVTKRKRLERFRNEILPDLNSLDNWTLIPSKEGVTITHKKV